MTAAAAAAAAAATHSAVHMRLLCTLRRSGSKRRSLCPRVYYFGQSCKPQGSSGFSITVPFACTSNARKMYRLPSVLLM